MADSNNPFAALLGEIKCGIDKSLIEEIFLFTLKKGSSALTTKRALLCLADVVVSDDGNDDEMSEELLGHTLFERLMLADTKDYLVLGSNPDDALEVDYILYLHRAFMTCNQAQQKFPIRENDCKKINALIIMNASTCMRQPDLYPGRNVWEQWRQLMEMSEDNYAESVMEFLVQCIQKIYADVESLEALGALKANFYPLLSKIQSDVSQTNLVTLKKNVFWLLGFFVREKRIPQMGEVLIDFTMPNPNTNGKHSTIKVIQYFALLHKSVSVKSHFRFSLYGHAFWSPV